MISEGGGRRVEGRVKIGFDKITVPTLCIRTDRP